MSDDKILNGKPMIVSQAQALLEQALAKVKAGEVVALAIIDVSAKNGVMNISFCGPQLNELFTANGLLSDMIKDAIKNPKKQTGAGILRPLVGLPGGPGL